MLSPVETTTPRRTGEALDTTALVKAQLNGNAAEVQTSMDADEWDGPPEGDTLSRTCPQCGAFADWPDCAACRFDFTAPTVRAQVSVITSCDPPRLSKHFFLGPYGALDREPGGNMIRGRYERREIANVDELATLIAGLAINQALAFGVADVVDAPMVCEPLAKPRDLTRTKEDLHWPSGPGIMMLDYDPRPGVDLLDHAALLAILVEAWPALAGAPLVLGASGSSYIYRDDTGECLKGAGGLRVWILVEDARDVSRAGATLFDRLWLAGHGHYQVSKSGALLKRSVIDATVWQPERLDFASGASVAPGLIQRRPGLTVQNVRRAPLDTKTLPNLTDDEKSYLERLQIDARAELAEESAVMLGAWTDARIATWAEREAPSLDGLDETARSAAFAGQRERLRTAATSRKLPADIDLIHVSGRRVTVGELLANPAKWNYERFADPLEPDYGNDKRIAIAILTPKDGQPCIYSHAHGGQRYALPALPSKPAPANGFTKTAPEPLRRPVPPPEPYPMNSLGPILSDAAIAIRRVIQAPDAICGASVLAAASLASQGLADVHHHGRVYPLSLWMLSVAESGERKTAVDSEAMRAAREFEKELGRVYKDEIETHRAKMAEWEFKQECAKSAAKAAAKKNQGVGLADALLDIGPAPEPPLVAKVTVADFTAEGVAKLLIAGRPTIGAFTDEAALVFGGHGMTKETVARTAGTLCKLWDSGTLDRVRSTEGATKLYGRRMALHLMAQPVIAEAALGDALLSGQGFLPRCLLAWPTSTAGSRPYVDKSMVDDPALIGLASRLGDLHRLPLPVSPDDDQELAPHALTLTRAAADTWRQLHDAVEKQMAPGARFATCKAWASKTPEQCMRIAGVLTMVESPSATMIEASVIERAAEIALYHLNEAVRLAGTAVLPDEVRNAEALLNWCHETGRTELYSREAQRLGPSRIRDRKTFDLAMKELVEAGWATKIDGGKVKDGAHRLHVWTIKPASEGV